MNKLPKLLEDLIKITGVVWLYPGKAGWYFLTIPQKEAEEIKKSYIWPRGGFGSIPVNVSLGQTKWKTSIFPEKKGTFLLPLKKEVRVKEGLREGSKIELTLEILN